MDQDSPLAARCDGHVAADEKGEAAEHLLLLQIGLAADQLAYAIREFLVVRHGAMLRLICAHGRIRSRLWNTRARAARRAGGALAAPADRRRHTARARNAVARGRLRGGRSIGGTRTGVSRPPPVR